MDRRLIDILILLLASGSALSVAAYVFAFFPFDMKVTHELQEQDNPVFKAVMGAVSLLGDGWIPVILVGVVAAICVIRKKWLETVFVIATLSSVLLTSALKVLVGRPRPPSFSLNPADFFLPFNQYSFPSGHVLFFIVFFAFLAFLSWLHLTGWMRLITIAVCGALIVLIAPSRIYLGAHWASDVIGSYIIGTLWLIILILLYLLMIHRRSVGWVGAKIQV